VALVFWAFRVAVIAGVAMAFLALLTWWRARRLDDPVALGRGWLRALVAASFAGWVLAGAGFVYLFAGAFPFAITGTVTFSELATAAAFGPQFSATIAYAVIYVLMMLGFLHMLWHNARYGVVPVVRVRGRA
jgi:cytochrome d ubiquinol oxidase subunit I